jgi:hypothetical protein
MTGKDAIYPNGAADWETVSTELSDGEATASPVPAAGVRREPGASRSPRAPSGSSRRPARSSRRSPHRADWRVRKSRGGAGLRRGQGMVATDVTSPSAPRPTTRATASRSRSASAGRPRSCCRYGPVDRRLDPTGDSGWFLDTGLVLSGDRIAMLSQVTWGQDYDWRRARLCGRCSRRLPIGWSTAAGRPAIEPIDPAQLKDPFAGWRRMPTRQQRRSQRFSVRAVRS